MSRRIRFHAAFRHDLRAQRERIEGLRAAIDEAIELVAEFPEAGVLVARERSAMLRKGHPA